MVELQEEVWKDIEGFENFYQVSTLGRIRSLDRYVRGKDKLRLIKSRIKNPQIRNGYYRVSLSKNLFVKAFDVHRLVAQTFIPNPKNKEQVNHKNGIKTDNRVDNLEWVTRKENVQHAFRTGLVDFSKRDYSCEKAHNRKLSLKDILFIRKKYKFKDEEFSGKKLAEMFNVAPTQISRIVRGLSWEIK